VFERRHFASGANKSFECPLKKRYVIGHCCERQMRAWFTPIGTDTRH
jgi:hypothetical protein